MMTKATGSDEASLRSARCGEGEFEKLRSKPDVIDNGFDVFSTPFSSYHPLVGFSYLACAIALSIAVMHPIYVALSLVGAFLCAVMTRGIHASVKTLAVSILLAMTVAAANAAFSSAGSTVLFSVGEKDVYFESLAYGFCSGGMLAAMLLWFFSYSAVMGSENTMALFGNVLPVVSLMISQVMHLIPQFVARGRDVMAAQDALSAAAPRNKKDAAGDRMRAISVLVGWGLEDGLVRGDAMRARGYACGAKRVTYRRYRLRRFDGLLLACIGFLAMADAISAFLLMSGFSFYPTIEASGPGWLFAFHAAFLSVPLILSLKEWLLWR